MRHALTRRAAHSDRSRGAGAVNGLVRAVHPMALFVRAEPVGAIALRAGGDPARFARFGLPVLDDGVFAGAGPLAGVLAGLDWAAGLGATDLLSVPGDTPFIPAGLVGALGPAPACAVSGGRGRRS